LFAPADELVKYRGRGSGDKSVSPQRNEDNGGHVFWKLA
jgi:hypothetical protein